MSTAEAAPPKPTRRSAVSPKGGDPKGSGTGQGGPRGSLGTLEGPGGEGGEAAHGGRTATRGARWSKTRLCRQLGRRERPAARTSGSRQLRATGVLAALLACFVATLPAKQRSRSHGNVLCGTGKEQRAAQPAEPRGGESRVQKGPGERLPAPLGRVRAPSHALCKFLPVQPPPKPPETPPSRSATRAGARRARREGAAPQP